MNKQELMKKCNKIIRATNGNNDDYVIALYSILEAISKLEESKECDYFTAPYNYGESTDIDYNVCNICNYHEQCNDKVKSNFDVWNYCPNCGSKIKRKVKNENFCSNRGAKIKANSQSFYGPFYSLPELNENNLIFATEQEAREKLEVNKNV